MFEAGFWVWVWRQVVLDQRAEDEVEDTAAEKSGMSRHGLDGSPSGPVSPENAGKLAAGPGAPGGGFAVAADRWAGSEGGAVLGRREVGSGRSGTGEAGCTAVVAAAVVAVYCNWGGRQMHLVIEQGKATRLTVIDEEQRHGDEMAELEESRRERQSRRRQQIAAAIGRWKL
ncbi:hypothetical protein MLD38_009952 [Melastoma candidum]|uniref:Uncharacterized protein n=1 Tax=Melastoma candidum TaxID=119954 RepID=A0ACB9QYA1_9MYRT|nr:hypothetical protein MLD38_009952 [Melastoma candidum]